MKRVHKLLVAATSSVVLVSVSLANTEEEIPAGQMIDGVELPAWQEEYAVGHFDTRLRPEALVQKVEIDHLRYLANASDTAPEDRAMFLEVVHEWNGRMIRADKRSVTTCRSLLRKNWFYNVAVDVGETKVAALISEIEPFVVDSEQV